MSLGLKVNTRMSKKKSFKTFIVKAIIEPRGNEEMYPIKAVDIKNAEKQVYRKYYKEYKKSYKVPGYRITMQEVLDRYGVSIEYESKII